MASITALATDYTLVDATITNPTYAYSNTSDDTAAEILNSGYSGSRYVYFKGFDLSSLPNTATVNSVVFKIKWRANAGAVNGGYYVNNTLKGSYSGNTTAAISTATVTGISVSDLKASSANNGFRVWADQPYNTGYVYGMEIIVDYTEAPTYDTKRFFHAQLNDQLFGGV